jgi:hypothetical protein
MVEARIATAFPQGLSDRAWRFVILRTAQKKPGNARSAVPGLARRPLGPRASRTSDQSNINTVAPVVLRAASAVWASPACSSV